MHADCGLRVIAAIWYCGWDCKQCETEGGKKELVGVREREREAVSQCDWRLPVHAFGHDTLMQSQLKSQTHWQ